MSDSVPDDILSWENLIYIVDFLKASGEKRVGILGGEPTLHPDFNAMLLYILERGMDATVFTCGIMADEKLEEAVSLFRNLPPERCTFVVNLNNPAQINTPLAEIESIKRFLAAFGGMVVPGFNICRTDFDLSFIFSYINEYGLHRQMRLGVAHPIPGKKNQFIQIGDMGKVVERLFSFAPLFEAMRVMPGLDCGFPMCRFTSDQLGWFYRLTGARNDFGCGPVIDIGPDLKLWSCFPLSAFHKRSLFDFDSLRGIIEFYSRLHDKIRVEQAGIFLDCDGCRQREEGICKGGCLAHGLSRFGEESPVRMKEIYG
jgi:MoaA/NifB/PqqE/SkfB family radical SAM enzyme